MPPRSEPDNEAVEVPEDGIDEAAIDRQVPKTAKYEGSFGGKVIVKVTKFGQGHVSSGEHLANQGDKMVAAGDIIEVDKSVADALEAKGYAEIQ